MIKFKRKKNELLKKKQEELATAALYADFAAEHSSTNSKKSTFVRGGTFEVGRGESKIEKKQTYEMSIASSAKPQQPAQTQRTVMAQPSSRGGSNLDSLMNEFKDREQSGKVDVGFEEDSTSSNLFISGLAQSVNEEILMNLFKKFGHVESVKVMWPRRELEMNRKRNNGFVNFRDRGEARKAMEAMQGHKLEGHYLNIGWARPSAKPSTVERKKDVGKYSRMRSDRVSRSRSRSRSRSPKRSRYPSDRERYDAYSRGRGRGSGSGSGNTRGGSRERMRAKIPSGYRQLDVKFPPPHTKKVIDLTAECVVKDGMAFERALVESNQGNPSFAFLFDPFSPEALYYRWKTVSLFNGDSVNRWSTYPFQLAPEGPYILPPSCPSSRGRSYSSSSRSYSRSYSRSRSRSLSGSSMSGASMSGSSKSRSRSRSRARQRSGKRRSRSYSRRRSRSSSRTKNIGSGVGGRRHRRSMSRSRSPPKSKFSSSKAMSSSSSGFDDKTKLAEDHALSDEDYDKFSDLLRDIDVSRAKIQSVMGFALDHALSAKEIVETMKDAMDVEATPWAKKVARLYAISDILHNTKAPVKNASMYRIEFQAVMPDIFLALNKCYSKIPGRLTADSMKEKVFNVLESWNSFAVFPPLFVIGLESVFLKTSSDWEVAADSIKDVDTSQLDASAFKVKCKQAGVPYEGCSINELLTYLALVGKYHEKKQGVIKGEGDDQMQSSDDDDDDDGEDMDGDEPDEDKAIKSATLAPPPKANSSNWVVASSSGDEGTSNFKVPPIFEDSSDSSSESDGDSMSEDDSGPIDLSGEAAPVSTTTTKSNIESSLPREILRQIEVEIMDLREELETKGVFPTTIEQQISNRRTELAQQFLNAQSIIEQKSSSSSTSSITAAAATTTSRKRSRSRSRERGSSSSRSSYHDRERMYDQRRQRW